MNVFVLCTGRCGSTTLIRACRHITNFSSGHESRARLVGDARLDYPENHIEADNRLSWMLGRLERRYGDQAYYVHLKRERTATAASFTQRIGPRWHIIPAYRDGILMTATPDASLMDICLDYYDTVNANIEAFLANKSHRMLFQLERAKEDFAHFWDWIGAEGDFAAALAEWDIRYNSSEQQTATPRRPLWFRAARKAKRCLLGGLRAMYL